MNNNYNYIYDNIYKIIIVGDANVGKTSFLNKYIRNNFNEKVNSTIGTDFFFKTIEYDKKYYKLRLWDTAGQERFKAITTSFFHSTHCALFCFDLSRFKTLHNIKKWIQEYNKHDTMDGKTIKFLIGLKKDKNNHFSKFNLSGNDEMAKFIKNICKDYNLIFIPFSSKFDSSDYIHYSLFYHIIPKLVETFPEKHYSILNNNSNNYYLSNCC